jgi:hypothetical protein
MRQFILVFFILAAVKLQAQNVGIGTTTPQFKLDVNGRMRIMSGGDINNTAGLWLNNIANNASPVFIGMRNDSLTGIFGNTSLWRWLMNTNTGNMALGDFNPTRPLSFPATLEKKISLYPGTTGDAGFGVFGNELRINSDNSNADITLGFDDYQNGFTERMRIKGNGNVGIGESNPGFPLNFSSTLGDKISLYGNSGAHYGFGIQGSLLQIHSAGIGDDIAFGYGSSSAFTESMRIKGNGNVAIGTSTPAASAQLDVSSTSKGLLPPRMTAAQRTAIASPAEGLMVYQTDPPIGYYFRKGGAWLSWGTSTCNYSIGQNVPALGGFIFYLDASGCHGLVCATTDLQSTGIQWYNGSYINTTAYASAVGAGWGNTSMIVFKQVAGSYAAKLCYDLSSGGFTDWCLPSLYELNLMYTNIGPGAPVPNTNVGGFESNIYWSSSEDGLTNAGTQSFFGGIMGNSSKDYGFLVRPVRAF